MAPPFAPAVNPQTGNAFIGTSLGPSFAVGPQPCVGIQVSDVTLSSAQLLALLATPVTLVPAPGVGFFIKPEKIVIRMIGGGAAHPCWHAFRSRRPRAQTLQLLARHSARLQAHPQQRTARRQWLGASSSR